MNLSRKILSFLFLTGLILSLPVYADDLDNECKKFCTNNGFEDGHYLAPEPGAVCKDGYDKSDENEICCCEPKSEAEE